MSLPVTLRPILKPGCDQVRNLVAEASRLQDLAGQIRKLLPAEEAFHLRAVVPSQNAMILWTDSAAWATRLRYSAPHLATAIRDALRLNKPVTLQIRVLPAQDIRAPATRPAQSFSDDARELIASCAEHTTDPDLRAAWQRLGETAKKKRKK